MISLLPQELSVKVQVLGERKAPDEVKAVIIDLCSWKALQASELATILSRDQAYITRNYLTPLIKEERLEYTIPDNPNHAQQAYKAVVEEENQGGQP